MVKAKINQQVCKLLQKGGYDVKRNFSFKGVPLDVYAIKKVSGKRVFMYVPKDGMASLAHAINLDQIRLYNKRHGKPHCSYMIISPKGATVTASRIARRKKIPIYKKLNKLSPKILI